MKRFLLVTKTLFMFILLMPVMLIVGVTGLKEVTEKLADKGRIIDQIYTEAGEDLDFSKVKCLEGDTQAKLDALKAIDAEVTELRNYRVILLDAEKALKAGRDLNAEMNTPAQSMKHPTGNEGIPGVVIKSFGDQVVESKVLDEMKGREVYLDIDLKTEMTRAAGWDPETIRESRVELSAQAPIAVVDIIPMLTTIRDTIKYMKETTFDNNAAEAAESSTYGEAALQLTEQSDEVEKIAVFLPVTDEQLEDVPAISGYINGRLTYMLRTRLDGQILTGNGSTPNLLGTLNLSSVLSQAKSTDPTPDAFYKAMTQVRVTGFAEPSNVIIHPNDWQAIRLLRTADGIYIFGSPMQADPERLWGVPVLQTTKETENTGIVGDYRGFSNLYMKRGVTLKVTDSHASNFTQGVQVIAATMRVAMVHYRDTAFCKVTGI